MSLLIGKFKMKIYSLLFFLIMIAHPSYAQWVIMKDWPRLDNMFSDRELSNVTTVINGEGGLSQVGKFGTYKTNDNSNTTSPPKEFSMYQYEAGTVSLGYEGNGSISTIVNGTECYIYPLVVSGGRWSFELTGMKSSSSPRGDSDRALSWLGTESVQVLKQPCYNLKADSNEIRQINSIVTVPTFYLARSWAGSPLEEEYGRIWRPSSYDLPVFSYGFHVRMGYAMLACTRPWQSASSSRSYCSQTAIKWGNSSNSGEIIVDPVQCSLSGDTLLDFDKVSPSDYHNALANSNLSIFCTKEATVKLSILDDGKIDLGPFKIKVAFDNNNSTVTKLVNTNLTTQIVGSILSAEGKIEPGEYQNSIIIIGNVE